MSQQQFAQNDYVKGVNGLATPYDSSQITLMCAIDQSSGRTGAV
jgi:hypothetical protein